MLIPVTLWLTYFLPFMGVFSRFREVSGKFYHLINDLYHFSHGHYSSAKTGGRKRSLHRSNPYKT